jgi:type IV pilus assembly protein PilY1
MPLTSNERVLASYLRNRQTVGLPASSLIPLVVPTGVTWLTDVGIFNGAMTSYPVFDTNGDGLVNGQTRQLPLYTDQFQWGEQCQGAGLGRPKR